jgi:hypothetical protein
MCRCLALSHSHAVTHTLTCAHCCTHAHTRTCRPTQPPLPAEAYSLPTIFCVNETEAQLFTGVKVTDAASAEAAGKKLLEMGARWGSDAPY